MLGTFYPSSGSWVFAESVWLQRGRSQTFLGSDRRCNEAPRPQIAAPGGSGGMWGCKPSPGAGSSPATGPWGAGGVSILEGFKETPETACERGTSATPRAREGKAAFEVKQERVLVEILRLHARPK